MPLIKVHTSVPVADDRQAELLPQLSQLLVESIGKPEQYVMAVLEPAAIRMSGQTAPAAFVEVRSIGGLNGEVNQKICQKVCGLLETSLAIPPERVYVNFTDVPASNWGWRGSTFG